MVETLYPRWMVLRALKMGKTKLRVKKNQILKGCPKSWPEVSLICHKQEV